MTKGPHIEGMYDKQVEHQMRFHEIMARAVSDTKVAKVPVEKRVGSFLTVSRQAGSCGAEVAGLVGARLGWSVLDKELVTSLAERLEVSPRLLELMDETTSDWFRDTLLNLMETHLVLQSSYVSMLGKIVLLAAYDGNAIIVGRGANFILPRQAGLRVRVVAPRAFRITTLQERFSLDSAAAEHRMDDMDRDRDNFVRRHFKAAVADPDHYDLLLDVSVFGIEGTADLICHALKVRGLIDADQCPQ